MTQFGWSCSAGSVAWFRSLFPQTKDAPEGVVAFGSHVHQRYLVKHDGVSGPEAPAVVM
jgi:hypothetical protein